jgi:phosphatidylserine/phosphatidylglycerophosphate/cardiolipin synthase-like enzyme
MNIGDRDAVLVALDAHPQIEIRLEYFDASHELNFRDRDLLAIGPVVEQMGRAFDQFWNSEWAL